jgi:hypothetical protein
MIPQTGALCWIRLQHQSYTDAHNKRLKRRDTNHISLYVDTNST